jgi:hypothetical protein
MIKRITHLLIVAGPSGAGKTTFRTRLAARHLPKEIAACLPSGAEKWPQFERLHFKSDPYPWPSELHEIDQEQIPGVVLDYKVTKMNYRADPALILLERADLITVVNLVPTLDRLVNQLSHREGSSSHRSLRWLEWCGNKVFWRMTTKVGSAVPRQLVEPLLRAPYISERWKRLKARARKNPMRKLKLYHKEGYLEQVNGAWQEYLRSRAFSGIKIEQIFVQPAQSSRLGQDFHWVRVSDPNVVDAGVAS